MIKKLVKIGDQIIPVKDHDIVTGVFCDRCGVQISEIINKETVWTDGIEIGRTATSADHIHGGQEGRIFKRLCKDCRDLMAIVAEDPDLDAVLRPYLKKKEPRAEDK